MSYLVLRLTDDAPRWVRFAVESLQATTLPVIQSVCQTLERNCKGDLSSSEYFPLVFGTLLYTEAVSVTFILGRTGTE